MVPYFLIICYYILSIGSLYGLVCLSRLAFMSEVANTSIPSVGITNSVSCCKDIDETKLTYAKVTVIFLWLQFFFLTVFLVYWAVLRWVVPRWASDTGVPDTGVLVQFSDR